MCGQFHNSRKILILFWSEHSSTAFIFQWFVLASSKKSLHIYMRNSKQFCSISLAPSLTKCFKIVLYVLLRHELDVFLLYLPTWDKKMDKYAHRYGKYWPDLLDIRKPINPFYTFSCQTSVVLITASTKAVMAITNFKKLKLNIES